MTPRTLRIAARTVLPAAVAIALFGYVERPAREAETAACTALAHLLGLHQITRLTATTMYIDSPRGAWVSVLEPSCSSIASVLALLTLAVSIPLGPARRRIPAALAGALVVVLMNIVRIEASVAVGVPAGRSVAVLFHDWVGSTFAFAYTLTGWLIVVRAVLPRTPRTADLASGDRPTLTRRTIWRTA